jgi:hypothetical protein
MPNALIPEVRVDKNGVPVTRHVRQQKAPLGTSIPQPVASVPEKVIPYAERESDIAAMFGECEEFFDHGGIGADAFMKAMNSYSDHTVRTIKKHLGDSEHQTYYAELTALIGHDCPELDVREYMMYSFDLADCQDLQETSRYIRGLRNYKIFKGIDDFTLVDPETEALSRSFLRIAFNLHCMQDDDHPGAVYVPDPRDEDEKNPIFKSPALVKLLTENPSRATDIAEHIEDRGFKSIKSLAQMIEGTHHATRDGFL